MGLRVASEAVLGTVGRAVLKFRASTAEPRTELIESVYPRSISIRATKGV
jgi:hypothetical protein